MPKFNANPELDTDLIEVRCELWDLEVDPELRTDADKILARRAFRISRIEYIVDAPDGEIYIGLMNGEEIATKSISYEALTELWYANIKLSRA